MTNADEKTGATAARPAPEQPELLSLASHYDPEQHGTYLRRLQEVVQKPQNLNIALTGRYGTGKSSVLDAFESERPKRTWRTLFKRKRKTLRITISTLGADPAQPVAVEEIPAASTLTNRIQKELVKQLIYRMSPSRFRFSRFNRIIPLSRLRATTKSVAAVGVLGGMLWLVKLLPNVRGTGPGQPWWVTAASWLGLAGGAVVVLATLYLIIHGRFVVSDVSAAGATVKLSTRSSTYFDEYLEEVVYFFDTELPDVVIFEDLDRFDDPHIFESLRELNTLLNQTPKRGKKRPLRFIYAIKDSIFEQLGSDTAKSKDDAVAAETVRANRTKFFDVVIPVVPFISHRNARELLAGLLEELGITGIDRTLVDLVARHVTDMRLLKNICNEYLIFAERLLDQKKTAPGLDSNRLFAIVAYKNLHLKDFEHISRRDSKLDVLYRQRQELVRTSIDDCEKRKRDIDAGVTRFGTMEALAEKLGDRLVALGMSITSVASAGRRARESMQFHVNSTGHSQNAVKSYDFWSAVAEAGQISVLVQLNQYQPAQVVADLDRGLITALFPEGLEAGRWGEIDELASREAVKLLDADITLLRGADFNDLVRDGRFTLTLDDKATTTFADLVKTTMTSQLARELVTRGYLDRNFALYAAPFHGDFSGVDVARFIVQTVETNTMDIDHTFSGPEAIRNLLHEAPEYFSHTISAYNVQILDHLLERQDARATDIARTIASEFGDAARKFLQRYFNSGVERTRFAALLSKSSWAAVFVYLAHDEAVPADARAGLVDAALREANGAGSYVLAAEVRDFLLANYATMEAFTSRQEPDVGAIVVAFVSELGIGIPDLESLDEQLRDRIVDRGLYHLTAGNLRVALGTSGDVSFDQVRRHEVVYDLCLSHPDVYLDLVADDSGTPHAVLSEETLIAVLVRVHSFWGVDDLLRLIEMAAPESRLERLDSVPQSYWPALAARRLFRSTVRNVLVYSEASGIDGTLAELLIEAGSIDGTEGNDDERMKVAVAVLNAAGTMPDVRHRVALVVSLDLDEWLSPEEIEPEGGAFLTLLIEGRVMKDSVEPFMRFRDVGWSAIEPAIAKSKKFAEFMTPELISGFIPELMGSNVVPQPVKNEILGDLARYVPDEAESLSATGRYSLIQGRSLVLDQIVRIATFTKDVKLTLGLVLLLSPSVTELVSALTRLGQPYSHLTDNAKNEFELPFDDLHREVLERLKKSGAIAMFKKRRMGSVFDVKVQA